MFFGGDGVTVRVSVYYTQPHCYTQVRGFKPDRNRGFLRAKKSFERLPSEGK